MRLRRFGQAAASLELAGLAFEQLSTQLRRYLLRRALGAQAAEDLEQEVYIRLLRIPNAQLVRCPEAYVYRIASNLLGEAARKQRREPLEFNSDALERIAGQLRDDSLLPDEVYDQHAREQRLAAAVAQLPPMQKAVFVLARYQGLSHAQIASRFGISPQTVKKHMLRAICRCRDALMDGEETKE